MPDLRIGEQSDPDNMWIRERGGLAYIVSRGRTPYATVEMLALRLSGRNGVLLMVTAVVFLAYCNGGKFLSYLEFQELYR